MDNKLIGLIVIVAIVAIAITGTIIPPTESLTGITGAKLSSTKTITKSITYQWTAEYTPYVIVEYPKGVTLKTTLTPMSEVPLRFNKKVLGNQVKAFYVSGGTQKFTFTLPENMLNYNFLDNIVKGNEIYFTLAQASLKALPPTTTLR